MRRLRNPYVIKGGPKLQKSVVAFVDILGYKAMVENSVRNGDPNVLLGKLHRALKESRKHVDSNRYVTAFRNTDNKRFSIFTAFTDNIVIGSPICIDCTIALDVVFTEVSYFQMSLAMKGFFVRGAISVGDLYMDNIAVFGLPLIEAIKAEKEIACNPRIVLAESAKSAVDQHLDNDALKTDTSHVCYLKKDPADRQYFVDYLSTVALRPVDHRGRYFLEKHKSAIEDKLTAHQADPAIWSKYRWVAGYHNDFCDICPKVDARVKIDS